MENIWIPLSSVKHVQAHAQPVSRLPNVLLVRQTSSYKMQVVLVSVQAIHTSISQRTHALNASQLVPAVQVLFRIIV